MPIFSYCWTSSAVHYRRVKSCRSQHIRHRPTGTRSPTSIGMKQVAQRVDQLASMMYDTALQSPREYARLMARWTCETIQWSEGTEVLLGIPAYDDEGVGYHDPAAENLKSALSGIHRGLRSLHALPGNYSGIAIYCAWEMDDVEWEYLQREFEKPASRP